MPCIEIFLQCLKQIRSICHDEQMFVVHFAQHERSTQRTTLVQPHQILFHGHIAAGAEGDTAKKRTGSLPRQLCDERQKRGGQIRRAADAASQRRCTLSERADHVSRMPLCVRIVGSRKMQTAVGRVRWVGVSEWLQCVKAKRKSKIQVSIHRRTRSKSVNSPPIAADVLAFHSSPPAVSKAAASQ
jgi:hypothetical protein